MSTPALPHLYGVIGNPVAHSLSPLIQNGWLRDLEINAHYVAMQVPAGDLAEALETLERQGCKGVNITLPHKQDALALADTASEVARAIGAANTFVRKVGGGWHAENTDAPGFLEALAEFDTPPLAGASVFILGAGGSARAVVHALDSESANITLCNRTIATAESLIANYPSGAHRAVSLEAGMALLGEAGLVINTTSLGHAGQALEWPDGDGRPLYDISYGKAAETFLMPAAAKGWHTANGLGMLVAQAALSFELWFAVKPDRDTAMQRCLTALEMTA